MSIRVKIIEVNIEQVKNGKNMYEKATVVHTGNGQRREQKIMSFSNPAVFKTVQRMQPGEEYDVEITKNDAGYNQWAKITRCTDNVEDLPEAPASAPRSAPAARTNVSTYETPEERKIKQMYIIKQSSISNALDYLKATNPAGEFGVSDVVNIAQEFVDFVYGNKTESLVEMEDDIPE